MEFSRSLGIVIGSVNEGFKNFMPHHSVNIKNRDYRIKFKDFNTDKNHSLPYRNYNMAKIYR